jgi:hypothetical protein
MPCGDLNQACCANDTCTTGLCKDGTCVAEPVGQWGYPCTKNDRCDVGLTCNKNKVCQNSVGGPPRYGASCVDGQYCKSQPSQGRLACVEDSITTTPSGKLFTRCGCDGVGSDCGADADGHKRVCTSGKEQLWEALRAPGA